MPQITQAWIDRVLNLANELQEEIAKEGMYVSIRAKLNYLVGYIQSLAAFEEDKKEEEK